MRSLRSQLILSHMTLVLLMGFVMSGASIAFFSITQSVDRVLQGNFRTILAAQEMNSSLQEQETAFALLATGDSREATSAYTLSKEAFEKALQDATRTVITDEQRHIVADMKTAYLPYRGRAFRVFKGWDDPTISGLAKSEWSSLRPEFQKMRTLSRKLLTASRLAILMDNDRARESSKTAFWKSVSITIASMLLAAVFATTMIRRILTPLAALGHHAERIASGDLSQHAIKPRADEIGALADSFNEMAAKLAEVRKSEVRKMQRLERISEAALESLYDPLIITDAKGRIIRLNKAAEALFGPAPRTPRKPVAEHISDRRILKAIEDAISVRQVSAGEDESLQVQILVGDDNKTYRLRATPMTGDDGNLVGSVTVLEDITYLKVLDRMKNEFIGVASHELRTPVTSLILSVQLLREGAAGPLSEAQSQVIEAQQQDLSRLEKLMRDLLDITKLEAGMSSPRKEGIPALDLMLQPVENLKLQASKKGVDLVLETSDDLPLVQADRNQIGRVLTNLVANAIRHTPPGGHVKVRADASENVVTFSVEDTGEGIPEEYRKRVFERFVQVPGATQGGAGLGLSIANGIVKAHGGEMSVESRIGIGSTFRFTLPIMR
ncbi:MAG: ATP-binding protein [Fimbriimonas sp.]|nr:ATP-binding protein [Fimbriimonas sp.]